MRDFIGITFAVENIDDKEFRTHVINVDNGSVTDSEVKVFDNGADAAKELVRQLNIGIKEFQKAIDNSNNW